MAEKASSMGLKSGEYGGRNSYFIPCSSHILNLVNEEKTDIPRVNEIQNLWMFVNPAVIHDDHRVRCWIGIHVVQEATNERIKSLYTKRSLQLCRNG